MTATSKRYPATKALLLCALICGALNYAVAQELPPEARKAGFVAVQKVIKPFNAPTLSGETVTEAYLQEGLSLIYFWSPKSDPKAAGIANLGKAQKKHPELRVLAISQESEDVVRAIVPNAALYAFVMAKAKAAIIAFGTPVSPSWAFVSAAGAVIAIRNGNFDPSGPDGDAVVAAMLATYPAEEPQAETDANSAASGESSAVAAPTQPAAAAAEAQPAQPQSNIKITLNAGLKDSAFASQIEMEVVAELNLARTNPKAYAQLLREYRKLIRGNYLERPGETTIVLNEGAKAVDEAIAFLEKQAAVPALSLSKGLSLAARDHARDQGKTGATGHTGKDGSTMSQRIERYGQWQRTAGENIAYGPTTARDIVIQLIVDDGVPSRGHRSNIYKPEFLTVGVSYGPHAEYGSVCVQDFAGGYVEK